MLILHQLTVATALWTVSSTLSAEVPVLSSTTPAVTITTHALENISATEIAEETPSGRLDVYSLHVISRITHRYARTVVSSRLANRATKAQEAQFSLVLPQTAFISAFLIETEGKVFEAYVKEKEEAKKQYNEALATGQTAAHVTVSARDANTFFVAVNVAAGQKVTFNLTYEELLARRLGAYTHVVHIAPGQVVRDLSVEVLVQESRNLSLLRPVTFSSTADEAVTECQQSSAAAVAAALAPAVTVEGPSGGRARLLFAPTTAQQRAIALAALAHDTCHQDTDTPAHTNAAADGLVGRLVLQYDVKRDQQGGEVLVDQGYFVHFFAPDDLPLLPKHVIFVLDVSGSMEGRKVEQLKKAMFTILDDLQPVDYFSLLEFSYSVTVWNLDSATNNVVYSPYSPFDGDDAGRPGTEPPPRAAFPANAEYIRKAKEIVNRMTAGGGTNVYDALRTALAVARARPHDAAPAPATRRPLPIVIFLSDGEPTVGESRPHKIFRMVNVRNKEPVVSLFSLAFGDDADLPFLKKLSLQNGGFARKIYEAADAALQLSDFYKGVASPLLSNVTFEYAAEDAERSVSTKKTFPAFFAGSELVVAGRANQTGAVGGAVEAHDSSLSGFTVPVPAPGSAAKMGIASLERLWAYLTIRQLLDDREAYSGFEEVDSFDTLPETNSTETQLKARDAAIAAKERALELALKYSFVTPLTSLIVVKPNGSNAANLVDAGSPADTFQGLGAQFSAPGAPGAPGPPGGLAGSSFVASRPSLPAPAYAGFIAPSTAQPNWHSTRYTASPSHQPPAVAATTTNTNSGSSDCGGAEEMPALGTLGDVEWLTNALNGTTGTLLVPLANGTRLLRLGVNEVNVPFDVCTLPENTSTCGEDAHCRHLPHCVLPFISKNIESYVPYFCSIGEFAGVCCPDAALILASNG